MVYLNIFIAVLKVFFDTEVFNVPVTWYQAMYDGNTVNLSTSKAFTHRHIIEVLVSKPILFE